eukprot:4435003-Pyramimonas_sp.AAC.1
MCIRDSLWEATRSTAQGALMRKAHRPQAEMAALNTPRVGARSDRAFMCSRPSSAARHCLDRPHALTSALYVLAEGCSPAPSISSNA